MKWIIETDNGDRFDIEVGDSDSLRQIKERIQISQGFHSSRQILTFGGNTIGSDLDLLFADIAEGSVIHLHIAADFPLPNYMVITIQLPPPFDTFDAEVDPNIRVERVKEAIQDRVGGTPIERIVLNHDLGMELHNGMTLLECQVLPQSRITVRILREATPGRPATPPTPPRTEAASSSAGERMSIMLKFRRRSVRLEVRAALGVRQLRERLVGQNLGEYFFVHNQDVMDEDLCFMSHNVVDGDVIDIFLGSVTRGE